MLNVVWKWGFKGFRGSRNTNFQISGQTTQVLRLYLHMEPTVETNLITRDRQ